MADAESNGERVELDPELFGSEQRCFGCSPRNPLGLKLRFAREGDAVVTRFVPGADYEGPPGILHGGLQATIADEIAAWTVVGLKGRFGFTASMQVRLLKPVRTGIEVVGRGRITRDTPRLVTVAVELAQNGEATLTGELVFALPDEGAAVRILGRPLPDAWRKLCR